MLRSLERSHPDYKYRECNGDIICRDGAYRQGTVWGYLNRSVCRCYDLRERRQGKEMLPEIIDDMLKTLDDACVGSISKIFDAEEPHTPRGCFAQAWSVAETLRVALDYKLHSRAVTPVQYPIL